MADGPGLRRSLVLGWQRRDRLAVVTIAVTVALFTGTVLAATAAATQTTQIAGEYDSQGVVMQQSSPSNGDSVTLPVARVDANGTTATVVGTTNAAAQRVQTVTGRQLPGPPSTGVSIGASADLTPTTNQVVRVALFGSATETTIQHRATRHTIIPARWYATTPEPVARTPPDEQYVLSLTEPRSVPDRGTPLRGALAFFVAGTQSLVRLLLIGILGATVLAGTTAYSVARMHVRDRTTTLRVLRTVGTPKRTILALFGLRSGLVVATGVALGYALGVIGTSAATNLSVFLGVPMSLSMQVTATAARVLAGGYALVGIVGIGAGAIATYPAVRAPPAAVGRPDRRQSDERRHRVLRVLDWRAFVPTTGALAVFVAVLLLVTGAGSAVGPAIAGTGATVTEPGATHPVASSVPTTYATVLTAQDVAASPEIIGFTTVNGSSVVLRGGEYERFAAVSDATLQAGTGSMQPGEAIIGADLADRLGLRVGDRVTVGGSTAPAFTTVSIVGRYTAPGYADDQLLLPLSSARHLTTTRPGRVDFVRLNRSVDSTARTSRIVDVSAPARIPVGESFQATVTVANPTPRRVHEQVTIQWVNQTVTQTVTVDAFGTATTTSSFRTHRPGTQTVRAGNRTRAVHVRPPSAVLLTAPERAPPNATVPVQVRRIDGTVPPNTTVELGTRAVSVDDNGSATIRSPGPGQYTLRVHTTAATARQNVTVAADARRQLSGSLAVPAAPQPGTRVPVTLRVHNPWDRTVTQRITTTLPGREVTRTVTLAAGERRTLQFRTQRVVPGSVQVDARTPTGQLATTTIDVQGDPRLVAAVAAHTGTAAGTTGIGKAIATVVGNLQVLIAVLVGLAGVTTVGSTAAAFARSVRAQYRTIGIHRVIGATRWQVCRIVFRDAVIVGGTAATLAVGLGVGAVVLLDELGFLTIFGIDVGLPLAPVTLLGAWVGALGLVVIGTGVALLPVVRASPWALVAAGEESR